MASYFKTGRSGIPRKMHPSSPDAMWGANGAQGPLVVPSMVWVYKVVLGVLLWDPAVLCHDKAIHVTAPK